MSDPYILFQVGQTDYAVPSDQVQQLEMVEAITPVPNTPPFVEGVVYLRGQVVPVINLRRRFGQEKISYDLSARLIVTDIGGRIVALAVDSAREFVKLDPAQIQPPPESLAAPAMEYLSGVYALGGRLILIINLSRLLNNPEKDSLVAVSADTR